MSKGVTLIELMIVIAIVGIIAAIAVPAFTGGSSHQNVSFGINGVVTTRCIDGYKFLVGSSGSVQQVLNSEGGGVRCGVN